MDKPISIKYYSSIRFKLIVGITILFAFLSSIFVIVSIERQNDFIEQNAISHAVNLSHTLSVNSSSWVLANDFIGLQEVINSISNTSGLRYAMITDVEGKVIGHNESDKVGKYLSDSISIALLTAEKGTNILVSSQDFVDVAVSIHRNDQHIGWVRISLNNEEIRKGEQLVINNGLVYILFSILIGAIFAYFFTFGITRRLQGLLDISKKTSKGSRNLRAESESPDEIGQLANEFNKMLDTLIQESERLQETQKKLLESNANKDKFFSIISHDLKSPFTGLLGNISLLNSDFESFSKDELREMLQLLGHSSKNIYSLLDDLLNWAQTQIGRMKYDFKNINIHDKSLEIINLLKTNATIKGIVLSNKIEKNKFVFADSKTISTVLRNLISNAIKFTNKGGFVTLGIEDLGDKMAIFVIDSGIGVSEEDISKIFSIEVHHTTVGTNAEKGSGIGLILCKELVEKNGGKIWVESEVGKGSKFVFTLPKAVD